MPAINERRACCSSRRVPIVGFHAHPHHPMPLTDMLHTNNGSRLSSRARVYVAILNHEAVIEGSQTSSQGLEKFSRGYETMGFTVAKDGTITYREWAPGASSANLIGEFSPSTIQYSGLGREADLAMIDGWNRESHPMKKNPYGVFEITLPSNNGKPAIPHNTKVKVGCLLLPWA